MALKPDGGLVETGPGPTDRPQESQGTWKLEEDDTLSMYEKGKKKPKRTHENRISEIRIDWS